MSLLEQLSQHWAFLSLGFVIGTAHALEADHLTAVATMIDRKEGRRGLILRGAVWGLGHTLALFVICSAVVILGLAVSPRVEAGLELLVGLMIAGLGLRVFWKLRRERIHIHVHSHGGTRHLHAHSHKGETGPHGAAPHDHRHAATLGIGLVHGAAGSAGLLVLSVAATDSLAQAMGYFAVFGLGSLVGMASLTAVASVPLGLVGRGGDRARHAMALCIGGLALWVGGSLAVESLGVALGTAG